MSINLAEQLEENEQYDKAYEEYKKVYAQKPKSIDVLEKLGHIAMILNKPEEAAVYYNKVLELDATSVLAYEQLMDVYVHTDRFKYYVSRGNLHVLQEELSHAINDFKKAIDKAKNNEEMNSIRFVLGSLYEQVGKNHQAIDEYLRILDTSSVNEVVFLKLAQVYMNEKAIDGAIDTLERACDRGFDTEVVKETLAQLYLQNNQPEKTREFTQNDLVKVKSLLDEERNSEAFGILDEIKDKYKKDAQFHSLLAQYYFNTKDWDKALEEVNEYDKFEKNSPLTYQMRGLIFEEKGNEFDAHINWARYNLARKDKDVALNEYMSAYQIKDYDSLLIKNIAELLDDLNDKNHAAEFWEKLAGLEPNNKKALERMAEFKERIGDYRGLAEILEKWHALDSRSAIVAKSLGRTYEKLKNKEKALEFYNKFVELSPVNEDSEQIQAKIKKIESSEFESDEGLLEKIIGFFGKK